MISVNVRSRMTTIKTLRARLSTCMIEVAVLNGLLGIVVLLGSAARSASNMIRMLVSLRAGNSASACEFGICYLLRTNSVSESAIDGCRCNAFILGHVA